MFRERENKKFLANSCICQAPPPPKIKSTIKQFIQIDTSVPIKHHPLIDSSSKRHSRIIELIDKSNRNLASLAAPRNNVSIKYPINGQQCYEPFPVNENLYDEIDPYEEESATAYDHLCRPYVPQQYRHQTMSSSKTTNCFRPQVTKETPVRYQRNSAHFQTPPPPPSLQKLPKVSRQHLFNNSLNTYNCSPPTKLNKSMSSTANLCESNYNSERNYLDKFVSDNSSGYNSSQDLSNQASSNCSIISYCSINEDLKKQVLNDRTDLVDSGFSTLNIDSEDQYDATENFSNYSNLSPSSSSSFNSSYQESDDLQPFTSPFPRIKTCMVAHIKKINKQTPNSFKTETIVYENMKNTSLQDKSYSVNDVLFSIKNMGIHNNAKKIE